MSSIISKDGKEIIGYANAEAVLDEFRAAGALLSGHFILSSGRHSPAFLQKALVFAEPERTERLCRALAERLRKVHERIDFVCGPAVGALIPAYETARALGCRAIYTERVAGQMCLRRNFVVKSGARVLIMEDHVTTGKSMFETYEALLRHDPQMHIVGAACLVDRSGGRADIGELELVSLARVDFPDYAPDEIPPELAAIAPVKPGSRELSR